MTTENFVDHKKKIFVENVTLTPLPKDVPSIGEFYAHQNVFITGGTGFMGKVLIEKLLRSCPKINGIYILLRSKRNYTDQQRLNEMLEIPLFDRLREEQPESLSKVKIIKGDVSQIKCGLSESDIEFIINEINIVFHVAASVRFDDPLKKAILINTRGTREIVRILKQMKKLKVFLHTSTTFCNIDKDVSIIEEKVYKATTNWKTMIKAAENMDVNVLNFLEKKILNKYPNTYTFVKSLAEEIVSENCANIPTVIFRPTIVVTSIKEPMPGWIDNFNGPMGLVTAVTCGVLHTLLLDPYKALDFAPVDIVINGIIVSAWYKTFKFAECNQCLVINSSTRDLLPVNNKMLMDIGAGVYGKRNPPGQLLWYPFCFYTSYKYLFWFYYVIFHLIPAVFFNILLKFTNQKLNLLKLYRRVFYTNMCLMPFTLNHWFFKNDNFKSLQAILKPNDTDNFSVDYSRILTEELFEIGMHGTVRYLLKDKNYTKDGLNKRLFNLKIKFSLHLMVIGFLLIGILFIIKLYIDKVLLHKHVI